MNTKLSAINSMANLALSNIKRSLEQSEVTPDYAKGFESAHKAGFLLGALRQAVYDIENIRDYTEEPK